MDSLQKSPFCKGGFRGILIWALNGVVEYWRNRNSTSQITRTEVSVFPPSPQGLRRGKQCSPLPLRFRRDLRQVSAFVFLFPDT